MALSDAPRWRSPRAGAAHPRARLHVQRSVRERIEMDRANDRARKRDDPWSRVDDITGDAHYVALGVERDATAHEIRSAYRAKARVCHPDKGGDARTFAKLQLAFETLSDPGRRSTYDLLAREFEYRYIPGVTVRARGGEDLILDDLERLGLDLDPGRQLVVLCEVCGRPSNKTCYVCDCRFCDFCTRKMHWKGPHGLHYPVHNAPGSMARKIAEKELESKTLEDGRARMIEDPNYRNDLELAEARAFKEAAAEIYGLGAKPCDVNGSGDVPHHVKRYDHRLGKYYAWAQTERKVHIAVHVPTGFQDKKVHMEIGGGHFGILRIQAEDSAPVVERRFAFPVDQNCPVDTMQTQMRTKMLITLTKATPGETWTRLFEGDPMYARCLQQPYAVQESNTEAVVEVELPFWIEGSDCRVHVDKYGLRVEVPNEIDNLKRTFFRPARDPSDKRKHPRDPDCFIPEETAWSLDRETRVGTDEPYNVLMICLVKRQPTMNETQYKKGEIQDNRHAEIPGMNPSNCKGIRLFVEDCDRFGMEDSLQAMCFMETGSTWRPAKPWAKLHGRGPDKDPEVDIVATEVDQLPRGAKLVLESLLQSEEARREDLNVECGGMVTACEEMIQGGPRYD